METRDSSQMISIGDASTRFIHDWLDTDAGSTNKLYMPSNNIPENHSGLNGVMGSAMNSSSPEKPTTPPTTVSELVGNILPSHSPDVEIAIERLEALIDTAGRSARQEHDANAKNAAALAADKFRQEYAQMGDQVEKKGRDSAFQELKPAAVYSAALGGDSWKQFSRKIVGKMPRRTSTSGKRRQKSRTPIEVIPSNEPGDMTQTASMSGLTGFETQDEVTPNSAGDQQ